MEISPQGTLRYKEGFAHAMFQALMHSAPLAFQMARPQWLFAQSFLMLEATALIVIKSTAVRSTDPIFSPISEFISEHSFELNWKGKIIDVDLMFGEGEVSVYFSRAEGDGYSLDVDPQMIREIRRTAQRVVRELAAAAN